MNMDEVKNEIRKWIDAVKEGNGDMSERSKFLNGLRMLAKIGIGLDMVKDEDIKTLMDIAMDKNIDDFMKRGYLSYLTTLADMGRAQGYIIRAFIDAAKDKNEEKDIRKIFLHSLKRFIENGRGLDVITDEDIRTLINIAKDKNEH